MKKIYTLLLITFPFLAFSQTITQADLPTAGMGWTMNTDTGYSAAIPAGGSGQTWNYSSLLTNQVDTTAFIAAAGTPYAATFPTANLVSYSVADTSYAYYTNSSSGFYINGVATPSSTLPYTPPLLFIPVPFSFGSTSTSSSAISIDQNISGTLYRIVIHFVNTYEGDASGSLTTPQGTYNALRLKTTSLQYDSAFINVAGTWMPVPGSESVSQSIDYSFLTSGNTVNLIMTLSGDSLGTTASQSSYYSGQFVASVNTLSNIDQLSPYPNPASNQIRFDLNNSDSDLIIYDQNGSQVLRYQGNFGGNVDVQKLGSGVYHYKLSKSGKSDSGSFVVQH